MLWTNGTRLVSGTADQIRSAGGAIADDNPWYVLGRELGPSTTRAILACVQDAVPDYRPGPIGYRRLDPDEKITIWSKDGHRIVFEGTVAQAGKMERVGVVAQESLGRWVRV